MRLFSCPSCGETLFFRNLDCESCGAALVYSHATDEFVISDAAVCASRDTPEACNWLPDDADPWCLSCGLDTDHSASELRLPFQQAKRQTVRQLLRRGVAIVGSTPQVQFELSEGTEEAPVTTGHANGLITLDVAEGDPANLVEVRESLGEPYRTPLGHVRHELGHWFWQAFLDTRFSTDAFRALFGDEPALAAQVLLGHPDLIKRRWDLPERPDLWWVADFSYVWTAAGFCNVSFITEVYSRRILGWRVSTSMTTPLVLSALEQALFTRRRTSFAFTADGLVHHSDAGSQGGFNWSSQDCRFEVIVDAHPSLRQGCAS